MNGSIIICTECAVEIIKTLGVGHTRYDCLTIGDIPLADASSLVADLAYELCKGSLQQASPNPYFGWAGARLRVRTGGSTDSLGIKGSEEGALLGELIKARCFVLLVSVACEITIALIIGEDDDNIWAFGGI